MTIIIILAIVALLVLWVIGVQRKLVEKDELCKNALSQIGVQQASRWDALTALVELVKSYNEHEYNTLRDVIAQRKNITGESTVAEAQAQEQVLTGLVRNINLVAEQYPELKANENYAKAMDSVNLYENQVRLSPSQPHDLQRHCHQVQQGDPSVPDLDRCRNPRLQHPRLPRRGRRQVGHAFDEDLMRRLIGSLIAALAFANAVFAVDWDIHDINVNVRLYRDGSAIVSEIWNISAQEGTEVYVPRTNLGDIEISDFSVSDETGDIYKFEERWDVDRSLARKAGRCGFHRISGGVELCWGLGSYGTHTYNVRYKMSNVVKSLNDYDMMHIQLYESTDKFRYESSLIALMRFDKGVFESGSVQDRDFQTVLDRAMDGSDYYEDIPEKSWKEKLFALFMSMMTILITFLLIMVPFLRMLNGDKLSRRQKRKVLGGPADKVMWYRDLPFKGDIYKTDYILDLLETKRLSNGIASAIILRMLEKGYLTVSKDEKGKVEIRFDETKDIAQLDTHERGLYDMMKEASGSDLILQDKEFSRWSQRTKSQNTIRLWANGLNLDAKRELRRDDVVSGKKFSEQGKIEAQHVMGFKNFLNDFTISSERESVEVGLWKDYLVYASLYGIADKVAKELKDIDPRVFEQVMAYDYTMFNDVVRMTNSLGKSITNARYAPQSYSGPSRGGFGGFGGGTSFGGGGGFSGGGHGGGVR